MQQVKTLERRLEALEVKGKPQPPEEARRDASASSQEIHELRQQMKNLEGRLDALESKGKTNREAEKGVPKVGRIIVVGNTKVTAVIRNEIHLLPGQVLDDKALRTAEMKLAAFDATIEVADTNDSEIKDILVRIRKK